MTVARHLQPKSFKTFSERYIIQVLLNICRTFFESLCQGVEANLIHSFIHFRFCFLGLADPSDHQIMVNLQAVQANKSATQAVQAKIWCNPLECADEPRAGVCDPAAVSALAQGTKPVLSDIRSMHAESMLVAMRAIS